MAFSGIQSYFLLIFWESGDQICSRNIRESEIDAGQKVMLINCKSISSLVANFYLAIKHYSWNVQEIYPGWFLRLHINSDDLGIDAADTLCHLQCNSSV